QKKYAWRLPGRSSSQSRRAKAGARRGTSGHCGIIRAMSTWAVLVGLALQAAASPKIDIVSVTGCLKETAPTTWMLVSATDPVPSNANAPLPKDIPATPPAGKNEFRLIGVSEFNL